MRKIVMAAIGSAVIALSIGQTASAHENQARRNAHRATVYTDRSARDANALYQPGTQSAFEAAARYSGGFSAPAGR